MARDPGPPYRRSRALHGPLRRAVRARPCAAFAHRRVFRLQRVAASPRDRRRADVKKLAISELLSGVGLGKPLTDWLQSAQTQVEGGRGACPSQEGGLHPSQGKLGRGVAAEPPRHVPLTMSSLPVARAWQAASLIVSRPTAISTRWMLRSPIIPHCYRPWRSLRLTARL